MARYRPPEYCPICGKMLEAIHENKGNHFVGDTFLGYKECDHKPSQLSAQKGLRWVNELVDKIQKELYRGCDPMESISVIQELIVEYKSKSATPEDGWVDVKDECIGFAHWKDRHFKRTYPWTGYNYTLSEYESVKLIPGSLYGATYTFDQVYGLYLTSETKKPTTPTHPTK